LGKVNFVQGTAQVPDSTGTQMAQNFTTAFPASLSKFVTQIVIWVRGDEKDVALRKSQGEALKALLGLNYAETQILTTRTSSALFPAGSQAIALLRVSYYKP